MLAESGRDLVQRALEPIALRLPNVNPNAITAAGLGVAVLSAFSFYMTDRSPLWFLVAAGLAALYGFLDALDGVIARTHGKSTPWGDFLDHSFDRLSALFALGGLTLTRHLDDRLGLLVMLGTLYHGFLGTQMEASFGGRVYRGIGIAEAIALNIVYSLTSFAIHLLGLPFRFQEPFTGAVLSVTDTFAVFCMPLIVIGTIQRFVIASRLGGDGRAYTRRKAPSSERSAT